MSTISPADDGSSFAVPLLSQANEDDEVLGSGMMPTTNKVASSFAKFLRPHRGRMILHALDDVLKHNGIDLDDPSVIEAHDVLTGFADHHGSFLHTAVVRVGGDQEQRLAGLREAIQTLRGYMDRSSAETEVTDDVEWNGISLQSVDHRAHLGLEAIERLTGESANEPTAE